MGNGTKLYSDYLLNLQVEHDIMEKPSIDMRLFEIEQRISLLDKRVGIIEVWKKRMGKFIKKKKSEPIVVSLIRD